MLIGCIVGVYLMSVLANYENKVSQGRRFEPQRITSSPIGHDPCETIYATSSRL